MTLLQTSKENQCWLCFHELSVILFATNFMGKHAEIEKQLPKQVFVNCLTEKNRKVEAAHFCPK
jgi:hypothetical protein